MGINNTPAAQQIIAAYENRVYEITENTKHQRAISPNPNRQAEANLNKHLDLQRRVHTARAYLTAKEELANLKAEQTQARQKLRLDTERKLLGISANDRESQQRYMASKRLAREAAGPITTNTADDASARQRLADLYNDSILTGDNVLAKSIAATALERGWQDIANLHFEHHPADKDLIEDIQVIDNAESPANFEELVNFSIVNHLDNLADRVDLQREFGVQVDDGGLRELADMPVADI